MPWKPGQNLGDDQDYTGLPDDEIARAVREHLQANRTLDGSAIQVKVKDGRVRLMGRVRSEVERELAERIVDDLIGVELDANHLRVEPVAREGAETTGRKVRAGREPVGEEETEAAAPGATDDPIEASDEGRAWIPPEEPWADALAATDPPHGVAEEDPRPPWQGPGHRPPQLEAAIERVIRETPPSAKPALESAAGFKEQMREARERRRRARTEGS